MQILFDQRLDNGRAEMFPLRFLLGLVHADAVVTDSNDARFAFTANRNRNHAVRPAFKAVDDGIGNEFIEDQAKDVTTSEGRSSLSPENFVSTRHSLLTRLWARRLSNF